MKTRTVETITSNEEHVRLAIFEGRLPLDKAGEELIDLYRRQAEAAENRLRDVLAERGK